jgi:transglutaminase-like putative cysteine protease
LNASFNSLAAPPKNTTAFEVLSDSFTLLNADSFLINPEISFMTPARRSFLQTAMGVCASPIFTTLANAQSDQTRVFAPVPGQWRTFEVTTRVEIAPAASTTRVWLPVPCVESAWQLSVGNSFTSNGQSALVFDGEQGVKMVLSEFAPSNSSGFVELTSTVKTQNRKDLASKEGGGFSKESSDTLKYYTRATRLLPTDGIVLRTAQQITRGLSTDELKVRAIYDWVVQNAWREPKVRGCGEGDIKLMLETGNLGGKCADINALFVGLCRSVHVPARDLYGIRLAASNFGYKELSGNPSSLKGAQHCRAEVYLQNRGWVAMDPADVAKVMRQETPEWIKSAEHTLVKPVYQTLFGGWEGNWLAFNSAHDLKLPKSRGDQLGFLMYPVAENAEGRFDSYSPDTFKYQITAKEII